jgi:hypothetical protein
MFDKESEVARDKCCHSRLCATTGYNAPKLTNPFGWRLATSTGDNRTTHDTRTAQQIKADAYALYDSEVANAWRNK